MKKRFSIGLVIALMLFASALTWVVAAVSIGRPHGAMSDRSHLVRDYYALLNMFDELFIGDFDDEVIATAAMRAAVEALDDDWSFYMTAEEFAHSQENTRNRYEGIGITVVSDEHSGYILVVHIIADSPAERAGFLIGDLITKVDEDSVNGFTPTMLRDILRRPIGDTAEVSIIRDGVAKELTVDFGTVFINPVSYIMLDANVGLIRLANFNQGSARNFISAANSLIELGAVGFVFDMRSNPGGLVAEMTEILDFLLPAGEIFVAVDRNGDEVVTFSNAAFIDLPMVVLVDRFSFSGAEYFAALLREYDAALVVGEQTTGKSRIQTIAMLPGGGAVNISFAEYLTKNRVSLHDEGGLTPDYIVLLSDEQQVAFFSGNLAFDDDPQLQMALDLLLQG